MALTGVREKMTNDRNFSKLIEGEMTKLGKGLLVHDAAVRRCLEIEYNLTLQQLELYLKLSRSGFMSIYCNARCANTKEAGESGNGATPITIVSCAIVAILVRWW